MQTNQIKKFATEARNKLKQGVAMKIQTMGFDAHGNVSDDLRPVAVQGGCLWRGNAMSEGFLRQWTSLYDRIQRKGLQEVYEEAAYTWFNRLVAIRILQKNRLCEGVLDYVDTARTPRIVDDARMGRLPLMDETTRQQLLTLLDDDTRTTEQFALLIAAWCHSNAIIHACFGGISDYTALLLPQNILAEGGFVDMLNGLTSREQSKTCFGSAEAQTTVGEANHTDYLTDDDYRSPELIGWLYQFYISERKDEVFAKKQKYTADEIPAATQIFTPNWIVRYMVKGAIEPQITDNYDLEQLKVADLACGSGHILNECFNLLFNLYTDEGYTRREAIESIFRHNLTGVDLDTRAKQLATFALLLKACQKDESYADAHLLPRVLDMPKPYDAVRDGAFMETMHEFFLGQETETVTAELLAAYSLMGDADSLGSIMQFKLSPSTRLLVKQTVDYWDERSLKPKAVTAQLPTMRLLLALTDKYDALVMNPPYMGSGNMNATLSDYVKTHYPEGKGDLFAVFMQVCEDRLKPGGRYAMINMQSWMFLSSFESLRRHVVSDLTIESMLHLGPRTFDELSGEVVQNTAFVIRKQEPTSETSATYYRLVDGKDCADKERMYLSATTDGNKIYYPNVPQKNFEKIPGCIVGYWASEKTIKTFKNDLLSSYGSPRQGMSTCDVNRFIMFWYEVAINNTNIFGNCKKWVKYNKGGEYRKWYGNLDNIVLWNNNGDLLKANKAALRNQSYYFKDFIAWSKVSSNNTGFRDFGSDFLFDGAGGSFFIEKDISKTYVLGFLNTKIAKVILNILSPTVNFNENHIGSLPLVLTDDNSNFENVTSLVEENISISKSDWDAHETSWDFEGSPLLERMDDCGANVADLDMLAPEEAAEIKREYDVPTNPHLLSDVVAAYKHHWERQFHRLHQNEEELNRQFITIYGLEDELSPDVPLKEVTILQQGEIEISSK